MSPSMNPPSGRLAATHRNSHHGSHHIVSSPVVVTLSRRAMLRLGTGVAALALIVLPTVALLGSGAATGSPTLVDQQLDGIVQAGNAAPTTDPAFIPAANLPLPLSSAAGAGGQPTTGLTVLGPGGTSAPIAGSAFLPGSSRGIPLTVLAAYRHAADVLASSAPRCGLPWWVLAGIGRVESGHAAGGHVDGGGTTIGRIVGPRLDGSTPGTGVVLDTDRGVLDGDPLFDRAVGPMQFLPSTWRAVASDGNGDGRADPNNVYDATLGAARLLCTDGANLATDAGQSAAVMRYNHSTAYVAEVLAWGRAYRDDVSPVNDAAGPIPTARPGTATAVRQAALAALPAPAAGHRAAAPSGSAAPRPTAGSPSSSPPPPAPSPVATSSSGTPTPSSTCTPTTTPSTSASTTSGTSTATPSPTTTTPSSPAAGSTTTPASSPATSGPAPAC